MQNVYYNMVMWFVKIIYFQLYKLINIEFLELNVG